jgi:hypothetical protein
MMTKHVYIKSIAVPVQFVWTDVLPVKNALLTLFANICPSIVEPRGDSDEMHIMDVDLQFVPTCLGAMFAFSI